jgi:outer membrane lipoprotein carrier protein
VTFVRRTWRAARAAGLALLVFALPAGAGEAPRVTALDRFLDGLTTWKADFTQTVVDGRSRKIGEGRGRLLISRPGRFRWELAPKGGPESGQLLVADGRNLWFFDRDLDQVTVKPMTEALSQSPAMLLSGSGDVRNAFDVKAEGASKEGPRDAEWVAVTPRGNEGDFKVARLEFRGADLASMELQDRLGQRTTIEFSAPVRNGPLSPDDLRFVPPPGVDVIGTPKP